MNSYIITILKDYRLLVEDTLRQAGCVILEVITGDKQCEISIDTDMDEASVETLVMGVNAGSYFDIQDYDDDESENFEDEEMAEFDDDNDQHPYYPI